MADPETDSGRGRPDEYEDLRAGNPPRHATIPKGSDASNVSAKTRTDPNTGEPNPKRGDHK